MRGKQFCVRNVGERVPFKFRAGKDEGLACFPADAAVDAERDAHIHGVAERVADDTVRAVNTPAESAPLGRLVEEVFLRVVEVETRQTGRVFAKWCLSR